MRKRGGEEDVDHPVEKRDPVIKNCWISRKKTCSLRLLDTNWR